MNNVNKFFMWVLYCRTDGALEADGGLSDRRQGKKKEDKEEERNKEEEKDKEE